MKYLLSALCALFFASCANLSVPNTGFLDHRDQLTRNEDYEVWGVPDEVELYVAPSLDASKYDSVMIDETLYQPVANPQHEPAPEDIEKLKLRFSKNLKEVLGEDFSVVDVPGPRTLRVRAAIAEVGCERVWVNIVTVILLMPFSMGGISGQIEIVDSMSGERLVAMAAHRDGTPFLVMECFARYDHAGWGMRKWAKLMRGILRGEDAG